MDGPPTALRGVLRESRVRHNMRFLSEVAHQAYRERALPRKQAGISETPAEIKAQVDADVADAEAIDDADAPASTQSQAKIQSS